VPTAKRAARGRAGRKRKFGYTESTVFRNIIIRDDKGIAVEQTANRFKPNSNLFVVEYPRITEDDT